MHEEKTELKELARLFLKLGITAFGGPAAHISMMQQEVVDKRKWMDHQHFLDLIGATNLIPGPNSTEMAIHIGHERGGYKGLLVAGSCFILPAVIITGCIAWLYQQYGQLPQVAAWTYGIKPAVIAIIVSAGYPLAQKALTTTTLAVIGIIALVLCLNGINEIYVMFAAGFTTLFLFIIRRPGSSMNSLFPVILHQIPFLSSANARIFFIFLKIGAILYGSGYVLFAFLDTELVAKGLLTRPQLIDAIAVGQFTPGPVFSSVTFVGFQMNGWAGAILATIAVFLPSFVFVALLNPFVPRMRRSKLFSAFLDGVNIASVAIILTVCISFGRETITSWKTIVIAILGLAVTFGFKKMNNVFVVIGGAVVGYVLAALG
jgi:chromate transporter